MMAKLMAWLHPKFRAFFGWWDNFTGLPTVTYKWSGDTRWNWSRISFVVLIWVLMLIFLPWY